MIAYLAGILTLPILLVIGGCGFLMAALIRLPSGTPVGRWI